MWGLYQVATNNHLGTFEGLKVSVNTRVHKVLSHDIFDQRNVAFTGNKFMDDRRQRRSAMWFILGNYKGHIWATIVKMSSVS